MQHSNDQLYFTGDLGHYDEHGLLYLHGRLDDQIKINGVPQTLYLYLWLPHSWLSESDAVPLTIVNGEINIIIIIITHRLPTNANGKVDRLALKSLSKQSAIVRSDMGPRGKTETLMAQLWQKHLELEAVVARDDDFFLLGGNSISAIIMGAELNRRTGKQVPLKGLFQFSRLEDFCHYVDGIECRSMPSENGVISHDEASAHHPFGLTDVQLAYLIGRDSAFELGGVSTHNYREDRFAWLDVALLTRCVNQLVRRHSALRTVYSLERFQRVLAETPLIQIAVQDVSLDSPERQRDALLLWRRELERQMFDTTTFPLFEWRVTQYQNHCVLHFSYDVLIMDARSMRIFMSELNELYRCPEQALPPLSITFRDYQLAHEQLKTTPRYRDDRRYWYDRLPELPYGPSLATAWRPGRGGSQDFKRQSFRLDPKVWKCLQERTRREKISMTVPFLALYGQVLARWSSEEHFLINLTLFQREDVHPDTQNLVGDFTVLSLFEYRQRQEPVRQLLRDIQERLWDDLSHTLFTGVEVQSALARHNQHQGGKLIAPVVFTSMLGFPHSDVGFLTDEYRGCDYARTQTSQVWLDNNLYERDGSLVVEWDYVCQLFDEQQISDMLEAYQLAIVSLANGDWDKPLHIPLPAADELLLRQYNDTACSDCMMPATLHEQFLVSAERFPDAPAVVAASGGQTTTYRQIGARAAQLAHRLQSSGVSRGERVMICAEKGPWLVFGALGILMAGAVFVPVNVQLPQLRRLSQHKEIAVEVGITITFHDVSNCNALAEFDTVPPAVSVAMNDPAYVIFTSGSTGRPKGVCISHGGVLNTLRDINMRLALTSDDRTLCLSNISFDLAIYDVFGPLMLGGAVVMPAERALDRPDALIQVLDDCDVSVYNSAPAVMALLVQSAGGGRHGRVRHVLLSGDFIPLDLPERIRKIFPAAKLLSLGGATEGSIWSICYSLTLVEKHWTSIPYGKPLLNQQVWILDAARNPCPVGVAGEIYLAGCGVALGYEADAEKTAAFFGQLPDGQRYYRTGDQGIMHRAGYVEILGRLDNQVKINGFRIELGEIDSVLQSHSAVQTSLSRVIAHGEASAQKYLVSYVVPLVFDRLAFKLEKRGIRNGLNASGTVMDLKPLTPQTILSDAAQRALVRKSYRHYQANHQLTLEVLQPLIHTTVQTANSKHRLRMSPATLWAELAVLLTPLRAFKHRIEGLNKYIYPSAGGLYPVRAYVTVSRAWSGCGGHYYYHPENHALMQLVSGPELLPETGIYLHLTGWGGYCFQERQFQRCGDIPLNFKFGQDEDNDAIINQASALLLLPPTIPTLEQGRLVQRISENLLTSSLGSCVLGQVKLEDQLLAYTRGRNFPAALAIGKIPTDDMANGDIENINVTRTLSDDKRFVRKVATAFVYKHRTIAQQAKAIVQCVLQPALDHIELNEAKHSKRLVLFSPSDSGAEAYYALAQALANDVNVIGINNFFINYPEKVTADCSRWLAIRDAVITIMWIAFSTI
ncbi:AMP-binding enzyme domain-containing protein [Hirsutella rhossiliensis]|uniref:AMP-binding enzyme domain-containing protein n=1 Tax=Hirsutella rhossiliensis TaxID=111463 RepID=A0A9P8MNS2_9HYPO|nr:AMP-binding enzyme domain-containing protein [Hirsutella rhossiliensis]KAH0957779.1 AMP-binding enzyme domain-containing protein [Hirsutella rhossiliensis]